MTPQMVPLIPKNYKSKNRLDYYAQGVFVIACEVDNEGICQGVYVFSPAAREMDLSELGPILSIWNRKLRRPHLFPHSGGRMSRIREYHQSEINTFLKCGKQWEFRYVQNIRTPPKAALTIGSSVDAGVTRNMIQKVASGKDLSLEDVLDVYSTDFDIRAKETVWDEDAPGDSKDIGVKLLSAHHSELAPKIDPETVQEKFVIEN